MISLASSAAAPSRFDALAKQDGRGIDAHGEDQLEAYWQRAKAEERFKQVSQAYEVLGDEVPLAVVTGPSFAKVVQPILESNCASCHGKGQLGYGDWKLETAGDAADFASGLALVTRTKYMPPWPASDLGVALQHPRNLDQADIDAISEWAEAGGKLDVKRATKVSAAPDDSDVVVPRQDQVLTMSTPYQGTGEIKND